MPRPKDKLLTPRDAAAELGISYATIKQWILRGKIKTVKTTGGHHRIPEAQLKRYLNRTPSTSADDGVAMLSSRNQLRGRVLEVIIDGLLAKFVLDVGGQRVTAIVTADAARELKLKPGDEAFALIKATEVMIGRRIPGSSR
jgi:molybdopterin-binding protein